MSRSLADVRLAALMLDDIELKGRCCVVTLGVTTDGAKVPLGLWDGSTENKRVCVELLADLVDRGLDCDQGVLVVLDGGKALRAAVDAVFGCVPVQRCVTRADPGGLFRELTIEARRSTERAGSRSCGSRSSISSSVDA